MKAVPPVRASAEDDHLSAAYCPLKGHVVQKAAEPQPTWRSASEEAVSYDEDVHMHLEARRDSEEEATAMEEERMRDEDNLLASLPCEVLYLVLEQMEPQHLYELSLTCRWMKDVCSDSHLWRVLFSKRWHSARYLQPCFTGPESRCFPPMEGTGANARINWRRAYEEMEWCTNRPLTLAGRPCDFKALYRKSIASPDNNLKSEYRRRRYSLEKEQLANMLYSQEEALQVQVMPPLLNETSRKASIDYRNKMCGRQWCTTISGLPDVLQAPEKAITSKTAVLNANRTVLGLDKRTGKERWRRPLHCTNLLASPSHVVMFDLGTEDSPRGELQLVELDEWTGKDLHKWNIPTLSHDQQPLSLQIRFLSPAHLLLSLSTPESIIINLHDGEVSSSIEGDVLACIHTKRDTIVAIRDGHGSCYTTDGTLQWELPRAFGKTACSKAAIEELPDGSVIFTHYASSVQESRMDIVLVDPSGREEWWQQCKMSLNPEDGLRPLTTRPTVGKVYIRGDAGVLVVFNAPHGSSVQLISWEGRTVFRHDLPPDRHYPWISA